MYSKSERDPAGVQGGLPPLGQLPFRTWPISVPDQAPRIRERHGCDVEGDDRPAPAGWSTIVGPDFAWPPVSVALRRADKRAKADDRKPECYCHGGRAEQAWTVTQDNAAGSGIEYAYAFDGSKMLIVGSYHGDGAKMVGMFGTGDPAAVWSVIAEVDLDGPEPDWDAIEQKVAG